MKRVGVVTITGGSNYGNKLQMYATQELLKELGCEPVVLRRMAEQAEKREKEVPIERIRKYNPIYISRVIQNRLNYRYNVKNGCDGLFRTLIYYQKNKMTIAQAQKERQQRFDQFDDHHIRMSDFSIGREKLPTEKLNTFDFFVCGSDQVWNPTYKQTSMVDFLAFAPKEKRIALAPSFGVDHIQPNKHDQYRQWLCGISHLSVREEKGADIIRQLTGREALVLADPVMALSRGVWSSFSKKPKNLPYGKYILCYFLGNETVEYARFILSLARQHSLSVVNLLNIRECNYYTIDPCEFVYLLAGAELVCTDSFHGTVFSILFHRPFVTFDRHEYGQEMGSRLTTLLKSFLLSGRCYSALKGEMDAVLRIDYSHIDERLAAERRKIIAYLQSALKGQE